MHSKRGFVPPSETMLVIAAQKCSHAQYILLESAKGNGNASLSVTLNSVPSGKLPNATHVLFAHKCPNAHLWDPLQDSPKYETVWQLPFVAPSALYQNRPALHCLSSVHAWPLSFPMQILTPTSVSHLPEKQSESLVHLSPGARFNLVGWLSKNSQFLVDPTGVPTSQ